MTKQSKTQNTKKQICIKIKRGERRYLLQLNTREGSNIILNQNVTRTAKQKTKLWIILTDEC